MFEKMKYFQYRFKLTLDFAQSPWDTSWVLFFEIITNYNPKYRTSADALFISLFVNMIHIFMRQIGCHVYFSTHCQPASFELGK